MKTTQLKLISGFGQSLSDAFLLAYHPDEWSRGDRRTLLLKLAGGVPTFVASLPFRASKGWRSANGTTYMLAYGPKENRVDCVYVCQGDDWLAGTKELDYTGQRLLQHRIFGLSGATAEQDIVFVGGAETVLFVRKGGGWQAFDGPPGMKTAGSFHGIRDNELYITTRGLGLVMWDGTTISECESPLASAEGVNVVSDNELVATQNQSLLRWTPSNVWEDNAVPFESFSHCLVLGGEVFSMTHDAQGIVRLDPDPQVMAPIGEVHSFEFVGDGLIASGEDGAVFYDGQAFKAIQMPDCVEGGQP